MIDTKCVFLIEVFNGLFVLLFASIVASVQNFVLHGATICGGFTANEAVGEETSGCKWSVVDTKPSISGGPL